jgi:hypothetical protein
MDRLTQVDQEHSPDVRRPEPGNNDMEYAMIGSGLPIIADN